MGRGQHPAAGLAMAAATTAEMAAAELPALQTRRRTQPLTHSFAAAATLPSPNLTIHCLGAAAALLASFDDRIMTVQQQG